MTLMTLKTLVTERLEKLKFYRAMTNFAVLMFDSSSRQRINLAFQNAKISIFI